MGYINIFVPGRVSIIGELSDLVVDYKKINNKVISGEVVAGGIDKGIYAVASLSNDFIFEFHEKKCIIKNAELSKLKELAKDSNFFSYVSSVAYYMKKNYDVSGINVKVRYMSLPMQKGLSSSASICVLVTKAYNILYNLNLTTTDIMEIAYKAERYALSMCGRLDQICAKGLCLSHIIFNEDSLKIETLDVKKELNFVITDLNGFKDTKKTLNSIHKCFPFPKNENEELVRKTLCEDNKKLVRGAIEAIKNGNKKTLGKILLQAQSNLDNSIGKICDTFEGKLLHTVMNDEVIQKLSYGSKGTGSNGDGAIIILARNKKNQKEIINYLSTKYKMISFEYNIKKTYKTKKAIINTLNNNFTKTKILSLLKKLNNLEIKEILLIGNNKTIENVKKVLNKEYSDIEFMNLTTKEKEKQIQLYRIYEKITFIEKNNSTQKDINIKTNLKSTIYISSYNKELIKEKTNEE